MAARAQVFTKLFTRGTQHSSDAAEQETLASAELAIPQMPLLRAFANEDIYFHVKQIDNSRVVRQADPASGRAAWSLISSAGIAAGLLVAVLLPAGYGIVAGYQLEQLRQEKDRLSAEKTELMVKESKLLTPERMEQLAREQEFADPTIVFLEPSGNDSSVASNQAPDASANPVR